MSADRMVHIACERYPRPATVAEPDFCCPTTRPGNGGRTPLIHDDAGQERRHESACAWRLAPTTYGKVCDYLGRRACNKRFDRLRELAVHDPYVVPCPDLKPGAPFGSEGVTHLNTVPLPAVSAPGVDGRPVIQERVLVDDVAMAPKDDDSWNLITHFGDS